MSTPYIQQSQPGGFPPYPSPSHSLRRDPELWFFDGNVVIVAQGVAFRVHKGVLACHSDVFRSWFTGPNATPRYGTIELFEGVEVVRLSTSDTAYDLKQTLLAIYGLRQLPINEAALVPFSVVAGLCRFAHTYRMKALFAASWRLLDPTFSSYLKERDNAPPERRLSFDLGENQAIEAFNIIKKTDSGYILMAMYLCAQLPVTVLHAGTRRADGTLEELEDDDIRYIIKAKTQLQQLSAEILAECAETQCTQGPECDEVGCEAAFKDVVVPRGPGAERLANGDAMSRWVLDCIDGLRRDDRICEDCARDARERHEALRESVWEEFLVSAELPVEWI